MKPADEAMRYASAEAWLEMAKGSTPEAVRDAVVRALDAAGYELRAKIDEAAARKLVQSLYGAAFHQGTLEHRPSPSDATLNKADKAVEVARAALMSALAAAPRLTGGKDG